MPSAKCHVIGKGREPLARVCFVKPPRDGAALLPSAFAERLVKSLPREFAKSSALLTYTSMLTISVDMTGRRHYVPAGRFNLPEREIVRELVPIIEKCRRVLPSPTALIAVFPRIARKNGALRGSAVSGTAHINLFINVRAGWKRELPETVCHEFFHSVEKNRRAKGKQWWYTDMVAEGLAEHFAIALTGRASRFSSTRLRGFSTAETKKALALLWRLQRARRKKIPDVRLYDHIVTKGPHYLGTYLVGAFLKGRRIPWNKAMHLKTDDVWKGGLAALGIKTGR